MSQAGRILFAAVQEGWVGLNNNVRLPRGAPSTRGNEKSLLFEVKHAGSVWLFVQEVFCLLGETEMRCELRRRLSDSEMRDLHRELGAATNQ